MQAQVGEAGRDHLHVVGGGNGTGRLNDFILKSFRCKRERRRKLALKIDKLL